MGYLRPVLDCLVMDQRFFSTATIPEHGHGLDQVVETIGIHVLVNEEIQCVDYEALSSMCFSCGNESGKEPTIVKLREVKIGVREEVGMMYGPWMMVEWKSQHGKSDSRVSKDRITEKAISGSRLSTLNGVGEMVGDKGGSSELSLGDRYACSSSELVDLEVIDRVVSMQKDGLGYVTVTHFNPTFKNTDDSNVTLDDAVLDSGKHLAMTFKENTDPNKDEALSEVDFSNGYTDNTSSKSRGGKAALVCILQKLKRTIRDRKDKFKLAGTAHISLSNFMNSMVKLINAQLSNEVGKDSSPLDGKWLEKVGLPKQ
ncbi:hypothetical protein GOBAR_AA24516 [Gossypium barbadense]|uniref:Uncharacterized protein n=1 Tax=Gossypium barbadense TaxID=3634 RepID=A0A2P5WYJ8_GOSBA|nr:hypothetical protein GOBAR_AA24516 [Gossypium barbadense]